MSPQRTGNWVDQTIYARNVDICICDIFFPCPNHTEVVTCPLGTFTPGDCTLILEFIDVLNGSQEQFIPFTVPEHDDKTLTASRETKSVRLDVNGIADCFYAIESSSTLTNNWTELTNHIGAPFTYRDTLPPTQAARFYRVRIAAHLN